MSNKLELSEICGYLPFGLKMVNTKSGSIIDVRGLRDTVSTFVITATIKKGNSFEDNEYQADLWPFKPLVLPLSALTESDWTSVFWAGIGKVLTQPEIIIYSDRVLIRYAAKETRFNATLCQWEGDRPFNQLAAFTKLYELQADLHGLIGQGKALDKRDFK